VQGLVELADQEPSRIRTGIECAPWHDEWMSRDSSADASSFCKEYYEMFVRPGV
jgi:hypothetical protein